MNNVVKKVRAAVYTRKSTDEGLEQDFNSLDAQREACESYIASQKREGWLLVPDRYDDAAFSGGTLKRPALQRLIQDIETGKIDCVVIYKIDRLSRSLMDFSKLVEIFDRHKVSFASITQSFQTNTSMGRLTLNMLLSFAQFEREVTAERIRDKIAQSKRRGLWVGGHVPLGYKIQDHCLVPDTEEMKRVQHIFRRFTQIGSATLLVKELKKDGIHSKTRTSTAGKVRLGQPLNKGTLYKILNNRTYLGEVVHKKKYFPGVHSAIIDKELWDKVHSILAKNSRQRANVTRDQSPATLKGIIRCGHCDRSMRPSHTRKNGVLYRYYVCMHASKNSYDDCPLNSVAAGQIEDAVFQRIKHMFQTPEMTAKVWKKAAAATPGIREREVVNAMKSVAEIWDELFPIEKNRVLSLLIERVVLTTDTLEIRVRVDGINSLMDELSDPKEERTIV